jgi:hypothetical protein
MSEFHVSASQVKPGILTPLLGKFAEQASRNQTFKLCFDGKKLIHQSVINQVTLNLLD